MVQSSVFLYLAKESINPSFRLYIKLYLFSQAVNGSGIPSFCYQWIKRSASRAINHSARQSFLTAKTQYWKFKTNILRKGIARHLSKFPHSCVCERVIYFLRWVCLFCYRKICGPIMVIYKSLTDMKSGNLDWGLAIPFLWIHKWDFRWSAYQIFINLLTHHDFSQQQCIICLQASACARRDGWAPTAL
jgi:hypothetical protein